MGWLSLRGVWTGTVAAYFEAFLSESPVTLGIKRIVYTRTVLIGIACRLFNVGIAQRNKHL